MSSSNDKRSSKHYLTDQEQLEIIRKLTKPNPPSKHSIACEHDIDEKARRKIWSKKDEIEQLSSLITAQARASKFRHSNRQFPQIEDQLFTWGDEMQWANLIVAPSYDIEKSKKIAAPLSIPKDDLEVRRITGQRVLIIMDNAPGHFEAFEVGNI